MYDDEVDLFPFEGLAPPTFYVPMRLRGLNYRASTRIEAPMPRSSAAAIRAAGVPRFWQMMKTVSYSTFASDHAQKHGSPTFSKYR